uniref:Mediator of RNA polymerase II transcription subunit 21 n=1 Tax=Steinernema glaseri TaxID=37863 RepID=A0A1I8A9V0_9BILA
MSTLEALLVDDDDDSQQKSQGRPQPEEKPDPLANIAQDLRKAPKSQLGDKIDNLMMSFVQFLELNNAIPGRTGPTPEHIKETAEFGIKDLLCAATSVSAEFVRIGAQFQVENPDDATDERIKELDTTIKQQEERLEQVSISLKELKRRHEPLLTERNL